MRFIFILICFIINCCFQAIGQTNSKQNLFNKTLIEQQIKAIDSLPNSQKKAIKLIYISRLLVSDGHNVAALNFAKQASEITFSLPNEEKCINYNEIGQIYVSVNELSKALDFFYKSEKIAILTNNDKQLSISYNNIASIFYYLNYKNQAITLLKKAIYLTTKSNDKLELAKLYGNLSFLYEEVNQMKAYHYSKLSYKLFTELGLSKQRINSLIQLYRITELQKLHSLSNQYLEMAITISQNNQDDLAEIYYLLGLHYLKTNRFQEAQKTLEKALFFASKSNNLKTLLKINNLLGDSYLNYDPNIALKHYKSSFNLASKLNNYLNIKIAAGNLKETYLKLNNYKDAFLAQETQMKIDSLDQGLKIEEVIMMNDLQNKNNELKLQKEKNLSLEIKYQKQMIALIAFIILFIFSFFAITSHNKLKELKNNQILLKKEVARQTVHLKKANQIQLLMVKALVHDLKSPLIFLSRVANRIYNKPDQFNERDLKEVSYDLKTYSENLIVFIEEFVLWIKAKKEDFSPTISSFNFLELGNKIYELYNEPITQNSNKLKMNLTPMTIHTDYQLLYVIVRNLIDNANKNTHNGIIYLVNYQDNQNKIIEIKDTGSGMSVEQIRTLYELLNTDKIGDRDEANLSLGYKIIMEFTNLLNCQITISSLGPNLGSTVQLSFKL